jgi:hypothetical protein
MLFLSFSKLIFVGRYKAQHPETTESMQADERAHELEEAVKRAPSASKRRASATASVTGPSGSGKTLSAGEALDCIGSSEHGDVSLERFAHRSRERSFAAFMRIIITLNSKPKPQTLNPKIIGIVTSSFSSFFFNS